MDPAEFDRFADEYQAVHARNIAASGETPEFFAEYKVADVRRRLDRAGLEVSSILDFGTGVGNSIPHLRRFFPGASLAGGDVSRRSLEVAERRFPGQARFVALEGDALPFQAGSFDLLFSACVFHHIPPAEHVRWLSELRRVARPGALLAVFEHNPWNPLTVRAVEACPFDEHAALVSAPKLRRRVSRADWAEVSAQYRIFFPRALAVLRPLERVLTSLPLGAQYVVYARAR